jgi:hypothetical protein
MEARSDRKKQINRVGKGIFAMLAIGAVPILFMNPLQYLFGLVVCGGLAFGLAHALV